MAGKVQESRQQTGFLGRQVMPITVYRRPEVLRGMNHRFVIGEDSRAAGETVLMARLEVALIRAQLLEDTNHFLKARNRRGSMPWNDNKGGGGGPWGGGGSGG